MEENAKQEILEAINQFAEQVDRRFCLLETEVGSLASEVGSIRAQMVTKSYLDDKLTDLRGDLVVLAKKSNTKLSVMIEQLVIDGSLKRDAADRILMLEPFPTSV